MYRVETRGKRWGKGGGRAGWGYMAFCICSCFLFLKNFWRMFRVEVLQQRALLIAFIVVPTYDMLQYDNHRNRLESEEYFFSKALASKILRIVFEEENKIKYGN
jgi:hypothetical protein